MTAVALRTAVDHATLYDLSRSTDGVTVTAHYSSVTNSFVALTVQPGTNYWYQVAAANEVTTTPFSLPLLTTTALDPPTGVSATVNSTTAITVSWNQSPPVASGNQALGYDLRSSTDDGMTWASVNKGEPNVSGGSQSSLIDTVQQGISYVCQVRAYHGVGSACSPPSGHAHALHSAAELPQHERRYDPDERQSQVLYHRDLAHRPGRISLPRGAPPRYHHRVRGAGLQLGGAAAARHRGLYGSGADEQVHPIKEPS